jgi:hypothetical protein
MLESYIYERATRIEVILGLHQPKSCMFPHDFANTINIISLRKPLNSLLQSHGSRKAPQSYARWPMDSSSNRVQSQIQRGRTATQARDFTAKELDSGQNFLHKS